MTNVSLHQVIVCKTHVIPLLNSGDALRKKTSWSRISLMVRRMLRDLYITKACPTFLRSSELSWPATLASRNDQALYWGRLEDSLSGKSTRPAVASDTYSLSEGHQLRFDLCHGWSAYGDDTRWAGTNKLIHLGLRGSLSQPTQLSAFETRSTPQSSSLLCATI